MEEPIEGHHLVTARHRTNIAVMRGIVNIEAIGFLKFPRLKVEGDLKRGRTLANLRESDLVKIKLGFLKIVLIKIIDDQVEASHHLGLTLTGFGSLFPSRN